MKKVPLFHRFKSADQTVIVISPAARVKSVTSSTPEGLKITLVSGRLGHPAAPHTPCAEQVQKYKQQQRQITVMQQTKAVALSLSASLTNQSKSPRDWAAVCDVDYAPSACVCFLFSFFSFFLLWYVLCRKTALLNLCARTKQSHPWTYSGAGFLGLSAVE